MHTKTVWFRLLFLSIVVAMLASCTPQKKLIYLQDKPGKASTYDTLPEPYRLQKGDMVYLDVKNFDVQADNMFDYQSGNQVGNQSNMGGAIGNPQLYFSSYVINDSGYIKLPVMGSVKLQGLTQHEANELVNDQVNKYLKDATAQLYLVNYNITLMGEVNQKGNFPVYQPDVNILELIAAAGGMTPYGNRQEVLIIRQVNGKETTATLDLTKRSIIQSPYFYLQPGDLVYVRPNRVAKTTGFQTIPWGTVFSIISTTLVIINFAR
mgnify:CR=1 FL=1